MADGKLFQADEFFCPDCYKCIGISEATRRCPDCAAKEKRMESLNTAVELTVSEYEERLQGKGERIAELERVAELHAMRCSADMEKIVRLERVVGAYAAADEARIYCNGRPCCLCSACQDRYDKAERLREGGK